MKNIFFLLVLCSCSSWYRIPTIRSPYSLSTNNGFLVSNIYTNPTQLDKDGKDVIVKYDLVVKNATDQTRDINLEQATIAFRTTTLPMNCLSFEKKEKVFKINSLETFRIQCNVKIINQGNIGDTKMLIQIPLEKSFANFTYIVRSEDFQ